LKNKVEKPQTHKERKARAQNQPNEGTTQEKTKRKSNKKTKTKSQPIRAMSGKGTSLLPSELTAAKWLAIRPLEFFSPSSSMASFTCAVCSMPYDTSKKRDQCASAHAKAVQGLAAVEGLSGQSLEEMKEEEEKKKK